MSWFTHRTILEKITSSCNCENNKDERFKLLSKIDAFNLNKSKSYFCYFKKVELFLLELPLHFM